MAKTTFRIGRSLLLFSLLAPAAALSAGVEAMPGRVTIIKPGRLAKFIAKPLTGDTFTLPAAASDPTVSGGRLHLVELNGNDGNGVIYDLPVQTAPLGWKGLGSPPGATGYKYKGTGSADDPCKVVLLKEKIVKAVCRGEGVTLTAPVTGTLGVTLTVGDDVQSYCADFGGSTAKNTASLLKRTSAPVPACDCGDVPPRELSFANGVGTGICGNATDGTNTKNFNCGDIVIGGGSSPVPSAIFQDMVHPARFNVECCTGKTLVLGQTTETMTGQQRQCTTPGCLFGPPLPFTLIPTPQSACVYLRVSNGGRGTAQCDTGEVDIEMDILGAMFLTGDILPNRCSGGTNPGGRCTVPNQATDCPGGGTCVSDPPVQPCPICNPTTLVCNGGLNNGMACQPAANQVVGPAFPTSHDCTVSSLVGLGDIPIPFHLSTGTTVFNSFSSSSQARVFCGFCRDADDTLEFEEVTPRHPRPCTSDAQCAQPWESCAQKSQGAFGPNGGGFTTATEIGSPAGSLEDYQAHDGTLSGIFCIPPTYIPLIDASSDLPGPGAVSMQSSIQLSSPSGAFVDGVALP